MQLSQEAIDEFKQIYKDKFGIELSDEEANTKGVNFLQLVKLISKPIPSNEKS